MGGTVSKSEGRGKRRLSFIEVMMCVAGGKEVNNGVWTRISLLLRALRLPLPVDEQLKGRVTRFVRHLSTAIYPIA